MDAAFILTEPVDLNLRLAVSTTTWSSAYKAKLLAVLLALLVAPNNCSVNLYSDCESIIKHFDYINNGGFINIRNIFKQPHHIISQKLANLKTPRSFNFSTKVFKFVLQDTTAFFSEIK